MKSLIVLRLLISMMLLLQIMAGCQSQPTQSTPEVLDPELARLLVDQALFPPSWYVDIAPHPEYWKYREGAQAAAVVQFRQQGSRALAMHRLFRYRNVAEAAAAYHRLMSGEFFSYSWNRPLTWKPPEGLSYQSPVADQFRFGCAVLGKSETDPDSFTVCQALGQYGRYVFSFFTWVSSDGMLGMALEDLELILKAIDERMAGYAGDRR